MGDDIWPLRVFFTVVYNVHFMEVAVLKWATKKKPLYFLLWNDNPLQGRRHGQTYKQWDFKENADYVNEIRSLWNANIKYDTTI